MKVGKIVAIIASAFTILSMIAGLTYWASAAIKESEKRDSLMEQRINKLEKIYDKIIYIHEEVGRIEANQQIFMKFLNGGEHEND